MRTAPRHGSDAALAELREIIGEPFVRTGSAADYVRDHYHPYYGRADEPRAAGAVQPATAEQLREILRIARQHRVPLWTISRGRNYGYGGPAPLLSGSIVLDLRRMDRILEINAEHAYAIVEPGVTPEMLLAEVQRRDLPLWLDGASSPYGSLIATALERGVGYGMLGERVEALCGLEVMLADGQLIRTGTGSLSGSATWPTSRYGYGPHLDGLFSQSNFGIVTKAGIWLIPQPASLRHAEVYVAEPAEVEAFMQILAELRQQGVLGTAISGGCNFGGHVPGAYGAGGGRPGQPGEKPGMRARLGYHGSAQITRAAWRETRERLESLASFSYHTEEFTPPYDHAGWTSEARLAAGIPSPLAMPTWDGIHYYLFGAYLLPNSGRAFGEFLRVAEQTYRRHGRRFLPPSWHMPSPRTLLPVVAASLEGDRFSPDTEPDQLDNEVTVALIRELTEACAEHGWMSYRAATPYMELSASLEDFAGGSRARINALLKDALDPDGILSPGKSGIWGSR